MTNRVRKQFLFAAMAVAFLAAIATLVVLRFRSATPTLSDIRALARRREFHRAQELLERYLSVDPHNDRARLLMAQITTEPTNPRPEIALQSIALIRAQAPSETARIKFLEGKAHYQQGRYDLAEDRWGLALRLDPTVPEAGWALIDLLDKEGRGEEAHRLGMQLHEVEPDPRDRVRILLEMCRLDIESPETYSQIVMFEPLVQQHPEHLPVVLTVGLALVRFNGCDEGLELLRAALARHPNSAQAWDTWLTALALTPGAENLADEFRRLPRELTADPRFAKHEGSIAQLAGDLPKAVSAYRRAFAFEPYNQGVIYRFRVVLAKAKETAEFQSVSRYSASFKSAFGEMRGDHFASTDRSEDPMIATRDFKNSRGAYLELAAIKTLGLKPHPGLYRRLADLRERMGRPDEARAWHRLVVRDCPEDALSLAALKRLK
jgi:tetratricopeptide (TPR) repeat protein